MAKSKTDEMRISYDKEADVLYVSAGKPKQAICETLDNGIVVRYDKKSDRVIGFTIIDFEKRFSTKGSLKTGKPQKGESSMTYRGVVQEKKIVLIGGATLPEGTHVEVIPEPENLISKRREEIMARLWATTHAILSESGMTSNSVEILRELREERTA
ncbi:DUF2283 domain-containing protein [Candidatus Poribacteria bacterium]|nr:DUF2283 domain-containing protein [Candidatus Poribacteria bacterium]